MQTGEPAETAPGEDAPPPSDTELTEAIQAEPVEVEPLFSAEGPVLWGTVGAILFFFLLGMYVIFRMRAKMSVPQAPPSARPIFEPAGDDAEITFDDEEAQLSHEPDDAASVDAGGVFDNDAAPEYDTEYDADAAPEIDQPVATPAPHKRQGPFAGLFSKKTPEPRPEAKFAPADEADEAEASVSFNLGANENRRDEDVDEAPSREDFAPHPADEDAPPRRARYAEELGPRDVAAYGLGAAARGAEDRLAALEARERELFEQSTSVDREVRELRRDLADELDERFAAFSRHLDRQIADFAVPPQNAGAPAADELAAAIRHLEAQLGDLSERFERQAARAPAEPHLDNAKLASIAESVSARFAEHREAMNSALASLSARVDALAEAPHEIRSFRNELAEMKKSLGHRSGGGAAPAVQLSDIVRMALPPDAFEMRAILANNRKADCLIRLPKPPGPIAIDARFPVEAFQRLHTAPEGRSASAENEFRREALRHIADVAERLIAPEETAESALMFIPSESMYTELHARFPDVIQDSQRARVWIVSPTTLMATLHTIRGVLTEARRSTAKSAPAVEMQDLFRELDGLRRRIAAIERGAGDAAPDSEQAGGLRREAPAPKPDTETQPAAAPEPETEKGAGAAQGEAPPAGETSEPNLWEDERGEGDRPRPPFPLR